MNKTAKKIVAKRTIIQLFTGLLLYLAGTYYHISLWYFVLSGAVIGLIFGKVFCRWMCPIGFIMELVTGFNQEGKLKQMYMYHKMGCPIAWLEGAFNRLSFFKIRLNKDSCLSCGVCDKKCYISTLEPDRYSLFKPDKQRPGESYSCSKCLQCVAACPNGSLKYASK